MAAIQCGVGRLCVSFWRKTEKANKRRAPDEIGVIHPRMCPYRKAEQNAMSGFDVEVHIRDAHSSKHILKKAVKLDDTACLF